MSSKKIFAGAGLIIAFLVAGCQSPSPREEEPAPKPPAARAQTPSERAAPQTKPRVRTASQQKASQQKPAERAAEQQQCLESVKQLRDLHARWQAAERAASAAPRVRLSIQLGALRKLHEELDAVPDAPCTDKAQVDFANSMTLTETFFQKFLNTDHDYLQAEQARQAEGKSDRQTAKGLLDAVDAELARIEACKGAC